MSKHTGNSTCRDLGHDWTLTAARDWRWCRRENCRASERLVKGQWVGNAQLYRKHQPVVPTARQPRQAALWDSEQH